MLWQPKAYVVTQGDQRRLCERQFINVHYTGNPWADKGWNLEKYCGRNVTDACLMCQLSPFITSIKPKIKSMSISSELSGNKHSNSKKTPVRQYLKCPLQSHNHGMKILCLILGTLVIISFLQKYKTTIFKSAPSLPPRHILHQETSRDLPC